MRRLAERDPDTYQPELAARLRAHARAEAYTAAQQCVIVYRERFEHCGDSVSRILADSLRILADRSTVVGRLAEAKAAIAEADVLIKELHQKYSGTARGSTAS
ncbi:hypothetical protein [Nocardia sp. bgisy118]|uniref:hypothetical protein n=1 Tax=Nocardia sp. bgisy118 TaxID=3413786 RepID=UPI003F4A2308